MNKFKVFLIVVAVLLVALVSYVLVSPSTQDTSAKEEIKGTAVKWETFDKENILGINEIKIDGKSLGYLDDTLPVVKIFSENQSQLSDTPKDGYVKVFVEFDKKPFLEQSYKKTAYDNKKTTFYIEKSLVKDYIKR